MTISWRTSVPTLVLALAAAALTLPPAGASTDDPEPTTATQPDSPIASVDAPRAVANVAHRGASATSPENTMAAIRQAIARDANFVGIDVRRTRDEKLVVFHDATLTRTTDVETVFPNRTSRRVEDYTLAEIQRLDAGSWLSPVYTGTRVPTLDEMLTELAESRTGAFLEIKDPTVYGGVDGIGAQVVEAIERQTDWLAPGGPANRLVVQAFVQYDGFLEAFAKVHPRVPIGLLGDVRDHLRDYPWAQQVNVQYRDVTPELVDEAHALDLQVATYVVDDKETMERLVADGVDGICTNRPDMLREVLKALGREIDPSAGTPPDQPAPAELKMEVPEEPQLLGSRVPVTGTLRTADGAPVRWDWVKLEQWTPEGWDSMQRPQATDRFGRVETTVLATSGMRLRLIAPASLWHLRAVSAAKDMPTRQANTVGTLAGPAQVVDETSTRLSVDWTAEDGRPVTGRADLWTQPQGKSWERARTVAVEDGRATIRVRPRVNTRYEVRFRAGSWWAADQDRHYIDNLPPGHVVQLPPRAPLSVRLPAQRRAVGTGPNADVSRIGRSFWLGMKDRAWQPGCPVGRARLRVVHVNYWGYDGYRHRGEVVVARAAAGRVVKAFREIYGQRFPIHSMYPVSRVPGGLSRSNAADNTTGFSCSGAQRPGTAARGRSVTVNPWENPTVSAGGVSPNRWWLPRTRNSALVHDSSRHPVVQAFTSNGFRWAKREREYARFSLRRN